eukprot:7038114-Ditylum_brightwellii.AAC.1
MGMADGELCIFQLTMNQLRGVTTMVLEQEQKEGRGEFLLKALTFSTVLCKIEVQEGVSSQSE